MPTIGSHLEFVKQASSSPDFVVVVVVVDRQVECEDQGDLGMAGTRLLPLRAPVYSEP